MEERPIVRAIIIRSTPTTGIEYFLIEKQKKSGEWYATNVQGGLDGRSPVDAAVAELHEEIGIDNGYYFVQTQVEREYNTQREGKPVRSTCHGLVVLIDDRCVMKFEDKHRDGRWHTRDAARDCLMRYPEQQEIFDLVCNKLDEMINHECNTYAPHMRYEAKQ